VGKPFAARKQVLFCAAIFPKEAKQENIVQVNMTVLFKCFQCFQRTTNREQINNVFYCLIQRWNTVKPQLVKEKCAAALLDENRKKNRKSEIYPCKK
jgi:hypothetical protein